MLPHPKKKKKLQDYYYVSIRKLAENSNQRKKAIDFHAFSHSTNRSSESPNMPNMFLKKRET